MKKTILLLVTILFLTACSSDDDGGSSNSIIGRWDLVSKERDNTNMTLNFCDLLSYYYFNSESTCLEIVSYLESQNSCVTYTYQETYSVSDGVLTIQEFDVTSTGDYIFTGRYYITSLTSTTLKLKLFYSYEEFEGNSSSPESGFIPESEQITSTFEKAN
jgi:hypothetical protein